MYALAPFLYIWGGFMHNFFDDPTLRILSLIAVAGVTFLICAILDHYGYLYPLLEYIFIKE